MAKSNKKTSVGKNAKSASMQTVKTTSVGKSGADLVKNVK